MQYFRARYGWGEKFLHMLDPTDIRLLALLQRNGTATSQELGEALNLSASQAARRKHRLEQSGVIRYYAARLEPGALGLTVQAFVQVHLGQHGAEHSRAFARLVDTRSEIVSAWTMTGEADYLLRVWTENLAGLNRLIHEVLLDHPAVARVHSQIVMDQLKQDAPLPL